MTLLIAGILRSSQGQTGPAVCIKNNEKGRSCIGMLANQQEKKDMNCGCNNKFRIEEMRHCCV